MSIQAGVIIVVIIFIRVFLKNRLPKNTFLILWTIVLLRLLIPFSFTSPFSVYSLVDFSVKPFSKDTTNKTSEVNLPPPEELPQNSLTDSPTVTSVWPLIWAIGAALSAFFFLIAYIRCCREFSDSQPAEDDYFLNWLERKRLKRTIKIRQSSRVYAPLTFGVIRPVILLPGQTDWTDTHQLQYVLAHELVHIKRFDAVVKILFTAALCVHWFNPLVWIMYILLNKDIELSCDELVVRSFGLTSKSSYAMALISLEEQKNKLTPFCNMFSKNPIEERITSIMKIKKNSILASFAAVVMVVGVTTGFATSAIASDNSYAKTTIEEREITDSGENHIDLASSKSFRINAGQGPEQSFDYTQNSGKQFLVSKGQKMQVTVDHITAFRGKSGGRVIKLIFEDSKHHIVEVEVGETDKKEVVFKNAGTYNLTIQNDGNKSIWYSFLLQ